MLVGTWVDISPPTAAGIELSAEDDEQGGASGGYPEMTKVRIWSVKRQNL